MKTILSVLLLVAAASLPLATQTLSEQLQKGIYTEETLKNRDEAVKIYRQIIGAPAVPRQIADEAQKRLAKLLLAEQPPVEVHPAMSIQTIQEKGVVDQFQYRHVTSGISFSLPPGWTAGDTMSSSDDGDMVFLTETATRRTINVWMIKESHTPAQVAEVIAGSAAEKLRQRHSGYGIPGMLDSSTYEISPQSLQPTQVDGRQAMIAVATYRGYPPETLYPNGRALPASELVTMNEYMTWICGPQSRVFFFTRIPATDLLQIRPAFDQLVHSAIVP